LILFSLGVYISTYIIYNIILLISNFILKDKENDSSVVKNRFVIIIPAHNEELFIGRILNSLKEQSYPQESFRIIVVADNCSDKTAAIASINNADVLERKSSKYKGKGYAIKYAIDNALDDNYDALFIIDADSILQTDGLINLNKHILKNDKIIQCNNAVANPADSWFSQLMDVSRTISNEILEPAKEKLGLSSHLMGNGMCFHRKIIDKYGWDAFTVGEDWEYYAKIINEGKRIAFAQHVRVYHQESTSLKQATPQRMRWSSGRFAILWQYGLGLFSRGLLEKNLLKFDASLPLILPNPSLAMNLTVLGFFSSLFFSLLHKNNTLIFWYSSLMLFHFIIFVTGVFYTRNKLRSFLSIFIAPLFLAWKMVIDILSLVGIGRKKWVRTNRHL